MNIKELLTKSLTKKIIALVLLLTIALLSIFVISKPMTSPETYTATIQSIDEKKATVTGITATAVATSTALGAIPGDATTPIANQILELSTYLLIVVCVLVLEKSLLTVMGYISFNFLIPIACLLLGIYTFFKKETLKTLAIKFVVFAMVIVTIIPFSLKISDLIYDVNKSTIEQATAEVDENVNSLEGEESKSWIDSLLDKISDSISDAKENAKKLLNGFIDAIALFIITYCAIPIIVVFLVIWFIKFLFGITFPTPKKPKIPFLTKEHTKEMIETK